MAGRRKRNETILDEAKRLTLGDRNRAYGHPLDDFTDIGRVWGVVLSRWREGDEMDVPPETVGLCLSAVKLCREVNKEKRDNRVDGAGYWHTVDMVHSERRRRDRINVGYKRPPVKKGK